MNAEIIKRANQLVADGHIESAFDILHKASASGDTACTTELGFWYLRGTEVGRDLSQAKKYLRQAASRGDLEAAAIDIALSANGSWGAPDWTYALAKLQDLSSTCEWARQDLSLIRRMNIDENGYPKEQLEKTVLDAGLPVSRIQCFVSADECQHIANRAVRHLAPSTVVNPTTGLQIANPIRTSEGAVIGPAQEDLVIQAIHRRIASATRTDINQGEPFSVLRYNRTQEYRPHFDAIHRAENNRIKTVIIYLNDGYLGGRTWFPDIPLVVEPSAGDAIIFDGIDEHNIVKPASKHASEPITQGVKWVATRWIRSKPFDPWVN